MCGMQELDCPLGGISVKGTVPVSSEELEFYWPLKVLNETYGQEEHPHVNINFSSYFF